MPSHEKNRSHLGNVLILQRWGEAGEASAEQFIQKMFTINWLGSNLDFATDVTVLAAALPGILISWLEVSEVLRSGIWNALSVESELIDGNRQVMLQPDLGAARFFRLVFP